MTRSRPGAVRLAGTAAVVAALFAPAAAGAVTLSPGDILVVGRSDFTTGVVVRIDPETGEQSLVSSGSNFDRPAGIALAPDGRILVADTGGADRRPRRAAPRGPPAPASLLFPRVKAGVCVETLRAAALDDPRERCRGRHRLLQRWGSGRALTLWACCSRSSWLSHKALSGKLLQALGIHASPALRGVVATDRLRVTDEMADFGAHP